MKRLVFGTLLLILVCLTFTLPPARADEGQSYVLDSNYWKVEYRISYIHVKPGQTINLDITFTAKVRIYDVKLEVLSNPVNLVADNVLRFDEIASDLPQPYTFHVKIPDAASPGTKYELNLLLQGYKGPPWLGLYWFGLHWYCRGWLCSGESPQYTQDTIKLPANSIVLTVT